VRGVGAQPRRATPAAAPRTPARRSLDEAKRNPGLPGNALFRQSERGYSRISLSPTGLRGVNRDYVHGRNDDSVPPRASTPSTYWSANACFAGLKTSYTMPQHQSQHVG